MSQNSGFTFAFPTNAQPLDQYNGTVVCLCATNNDNNVIESSADAETLVPAFGTVLFTRYAMPIAEQVVMFFVRKVAEMGGQYELVRRAAPETDVAVAEPRVEIEINEPVPVGQHAPVSRAAPETHVAVEPPQRVEIRTNNEPDPGGAYCKIM